MAEVSGHRRQRLHPATGRLLITFCWRDQGSSPDVGIAIWGCRSRHCEDAATKQSILFLPSASGVLRFARNDVEGRSQ